MHRNCFLGRRRPFSKAGHEPGFRALSAGVADSRLLLLVPILLAHGGVSGLNWLTVLIGVLGGFTNGLGAWYLFASLEAGAKASIAVPLTALNPLLTIILALGFLRERLTVVQWGAITAALIAGAMISYETEAS
jgi:transporter family protein